MNKFPWGALLRTGLLDMHMAPRDFWQSTLRELSAVFPKSQNTPDRDALTKLMNEFPDEG
jgi:uncharacterized phage protein (TIGR02216 family)